MIQSFVSMGVTTIVWYAAGYSLSFSGDVGGVIGSLDHAFLRGIDVTTLYASAVIPLFVFITYQMRFAIITPALITGAFANRVRFGTYLFFLVAWLILVYFPMAHIIWGGGILGTVSLGLWADASVNPAGVNGLFLGNPDFFVKELLAVAFTSVYAFGIWYGMLWLINKITPVKATRQEEENGLDNALHGEAAYEMI